MIAGVQSNYCALLGFVHHSKLSDNRPNCAVNYFHLTLGLSAKRFVAAVMNSFWHLLDVVVSLILDVS